MNPTTPTSEQLAAREQHEQDCEAVRIADIEALNLNRALQAKLARERGEEQGFDQSRPVEPPSEETA